MSEKNEKKWSEMTLEEKRAVLPKNLNKYGQWLLSEAGQEGYLEIVDMEAVQE
ncbi:MAG: hypothetical protein LUC91_01635 [Prevotella sp.]|nr:hypothetical protein [Prevotella sp.]